MRSRTLLRRRSVRWAIFWLIVLGFCAVGGLIVDRLGEVPPTQADAEAHLDRSILAYDIWDDTPVAVFEYGGTVHFDRLILDWISIEWPPTPRWQWTGFWSTIDATTGPASVGLSTFNATIVPPGVGVGGISSERVIYGQVNSAEIVALEVQVNGEWHRYPVAFPGFVLRLPEDQRNPEGYRWLDAEGRVVWSVERDVVTRRVDRF